MASLIVLSGPSGVGKTTLCKSLLRLSKKRLIRSVSHTTRMMRPSEVEGRDYYFVSKEQFNLMLQNEGFVEYTEYLNNLYGTSREFLDTAINADKDILLILDHVGAKSIKELYPTNSHLIFCTPPSIEVLKSRLEQRKSSTSEEIRDRLLISKASIATKEAYDHVVVNDKLNTTIYNLCVLINTISGKSIFEV